MTADSLATVIFKKPVWLFLLATPLTAVTFKATLKQGIKNRTQAETQKQPNFSFTEGEFGHIAVSVCFQNTVNSDSDSENVS